MQIRKWNFSWLADHQWKLANFQCQMHASWEGRRGFSPRGEVESRSNRGRVEKLREASSVPVRYSSAVALRTLERINNYDFRCHVITDLADRG